MRIWSLEMQKTKPRDPKRSVTILLFSDFSNLCLANAVEPLRAANTLARRDLYRWSFAGLAPGRILSSSGLPVQISLKLSDARSGDFLFVMPSYRHKEHATAGCMRTLRAARARFGLIAGLDTGSWLIAAAGLLDGRRATIHWDELTAFAETFPEVAVSEDRVVIDRDVASCGGATTTLELLLELIERDHGAALGLDVAALFMHGERDPKLDPTLRLSDDQIVRAAAAIMRRNLETPIRIADLAAALGLSQRALETRFRRSKQKTPASFYQLIRLAEARRLTEQTTLSIAEIADRCGYENAAAMTRAYKACFGATPSAHRSEGEWRRG